MAYETGHRSGPRAIAAYVAAICVAIILSFLVRACVITDHVL